MATRSKPKARKASRLMPVINSDVAGIDIGATEIYVAVPPERADEPVHCFSSFTEDLHAIAEWLAGCGVKSVAMESTGVYWIALFQILEARGFDVCLVNARHVKNVPGRKSDVSDCQWLQYLHSVGLLRASFRPPQAVCAVRAILRHRESLIQLASTHVQHMQKALTQMNLQLHHVLSDLTGKTGLAIVSAILEGERDPNVLAKLRDYRIKASEPTVAKALVGDYRPEHLFTLGQALQSYRHYQRLMGECESEIERQLHTFESVDPTAEPLPPRSAASKKSQGKAWQFDLRSELYRILGVDLTTVPALEVATIHTVFTEIGGNLGAFPTHKHFSSWLGLSPDNRISGGKVLSVRTREVKSRAAAALRMAAQSLHHSTSALGAYYRRMRTKLGAPKAITAAAHKLARIIYHLLKTRQPYDESRFAEHEQRYQRHRARRLHQQAAALGFTLVPRSSTQTT